MGIGYHWRDTVTVKRPIAESTSYSTVETGMQIKIKEYVVSGGRNTMAMRELGVTHIARSPATLTVLAGDLLVRDSDDAAFRVLTVYQIAQPRPGHTLFHIARDLEPS